MSNDNGKILTYPSDWTVEGIYDGYKRGNIYIPVFQRNFVWDKKRASLLIDSIMKGYPISNLSGYIDEDNKSVVIDGSQRIRTVVAFIDNKWEDDEFRLELDEDNPYNDFRYEDFSESDQRYFRNNCVMRMMNIVEFDKMSEDNKYEIFKRMNTGGMVMQGQEVRNCLYNGQLVSDLDDLSNNEYWKGLYVGETKHQEDKELILRIFALSNYEYKPPMDNFLNTVMRDNINADSEKWCKFLNDFGDLCELVSKRFSSGVTPFVKNELEAIFCGLIGVNGNEWKGGGANADYYYNEMVNQSDYPKFLNEEDTDNEGAIITRIHLVKKHLTK